MRFNHEREPYCCRIVTDEFACNAGWLNQPVSSVIISGFQMWPNPDNAFNAKAHACVSNVTFWASELDSVSLLPVVAELDCRDHFTRQQHLCDSYLA
jgi:hypothetical protein